MSRFRRNDDREIESRLRESRATPPQHLLDHLTSLVERSSRREHRRPRVAVALAFCVLLAVGMAAFGGVGYAKTSVVTAAKQSGNAVAAIVRKDEPATKKRVKTGIKTSGLGWHHDPPWSHQYSKFVVICYPFKLHGHTFWRTIVVPRIFLSYFVPPGTVGACPQ
jgi:hypothetical protein